MLLFEFQEQSSKKRPKTKIIFDNSKITKQMIQESNFLFYESNEIELIDPLYYNNLILHTPLKIFKYYLASFFKLQIKKILKKFNF